MILNKKGTHVGVVISFVIFITFVVFLYIIVQPKIASSTKTNTLDYVEIRILENLSADVTGISVGLANIESTCATLTGFFTEVGIDDKILVSNSVGQGLDVGKSGNDLVVQKGNQDFFLNIYNSEDFASILDTSSCTTITYTIGMVKTTKITVEQKIIDLIRVYEIDYEGLKKNFVIPSTDEFSFSFKYANGTTIETAEKNVSISVFSDTTSIRYINNKGFEEQGLLGVKVW